MTDPHHRNCVECRHLVYDQDATYWISGLAVTIHCAKWHWVLNTHRDTREMFRDHLLTARTCAEYEEEAGEDES